MDVIQRTVTVRELCEGYFNDEEEGVVAYDELLDVRPPYQREFVYKPAQRDEVIRSVLAGFPLSVFYWAVAPGGKFEMLDGQQRTMSICEYVDGSFTVDDLLFNNLPKDRQDAILDYELIVYVCDGTDSEKLKWFKVINIAGEKLTEQELRNAIYAGPWVSDARRYFSKTAGPAYQLASDYMTGEPVRQAYLEAVLKWAAEKDGDPSIEAFMGKHQHDTDAKALWNYFQKVIKWTRTTFPKYRREMKGLPWGEYYNDHKDDALDPAALEARVAALMADEEVTKKKGIYEYLLTGEERHLSLRQFDDRDKRTAYEQQKGICPLCGKHFEYGEMHGDHIIPWSKGGKTVLENCQMLCTPCNITKSNQ